MSTTFAGSVTIEGGNLELGKADTSSGHINAKELMTFNIDTDNDDTNRYFAWYKDSSSGSGTELFKILESGAATFGGNLTVTGGTVTLGSDVSIFRDGANILRTDDALHANANLHVGGGGIIYNRADTNNYIKFNSPNVQIKGHLLPDSDGSYKLGLGSGTNLRWNGIELTSGCLLYTSPSPRDS